MGKEGRIGARRRVVLSGRSAGHECLLAAMNEPLSKRRSTAVSIDLLGLKDQWLAWCASQGATPSQAFRAIVQRLTGSSDPVIATPAPEAAPLRTAPPGEATVQRISLRLTASELDAVVQRAGVAAMTPSRWIRALVRSHLTREPQFGDRELEAVIQSTTQLRYIGRNLNQVAKGLNACNSPTSTVDGGSLDQTSTRCRSSSKATRHF
jgi:hypothetical protein